MVNYGLDISDSNRITYATHEFESKHRSLKDLNSSQIGLGFKDLNIRPQRKLCAYPTNPNLNPLKIRVRIRFSNFSYISGIKRFRLDFIIIVLLSTQVEKDDSLPQSVCLTCLDSTAQFLAFRETCHQTQVTLKRQLSSPVSSVSLPLLQSCF